MSEGIEWGLHCCLVLAWLDDVAPLPVGRLAEVFDLPPEYLKKQLQPLAKAGILQSVAGARGGYRLGREPEAISLMDVVTAIEGGTNPFQCTEIRQRGSGQFATPGEFAQPLWHLPCDAESRTGLAARTRGPDTGRPDQRDTRHVRAPRPNLHRTHRLTAT